MANNYFINSCSGISKLSQITNCYSLHVKSNSMYKVKVQITKNSCNSIPCVPQSTYAWNDKLVSNIFHFFPILHKLLRILVLLVDVGKDIPLPGKISYSIKALKRSWCFMVLNPNIFLLEIFLMDIVIHPWSKWGWLKLPLHMQPWVQLITYLHQ